MLSSGAKVSYTDHVYWDRQRGRHQYVREFPASLQPYIGRAFKRSFPKGVIPTEEMIYEADGAYYDRMNKRTAPVLRPLLMHAMLTEKVELIAELDATQAELDRVLAENARREELERLGEQVARLGGSITLPDELLAEPHKKVPAIQAVKDLESHPRHKRGWRNERQKKKFEDCKLRAINSFLAFVGTDDMADPKITADLFQEWVDTLDDDTTVAHDYVADCKALFKATKGKRRFTDKARAAEVAEINDIPTPFKPKPKTERVPLVQAKRILEDARSREPVVRWLHWCAAFMGLIESEIVDAPASEIKFVDGRWWWYVGETRELKKTHRRRVMLIHPALIREGFIDYVQTRNGKRLFDESAEQAANRVRRHLRVQLGISERNQVFYGWRHDFISQLTNNKVELTLRKTLQGHGSKEVDFLHYIHHRKADLIAAIEGIEDPTV
jgi:hypothetical protein